MGDCVDQSSCQFGGRSRFVRRRACSLGLRACSVRAPASEPPVSEPAVSEPAVSASAPGAEAPACGPEASAPPWYRRVTRGAFADLSPLRDNADYRRVWFGQAVSSIGQQMTAVAVSVQVYDLTGSSFATGLVGLFSLFPLIAFGLYGGAIADTVDRRRLGLIGSAGLAAVSAVLAAQALAGLGLVAVLYAAVAVQAGFFALSSPARSAMIPRLVPSHQLPAANALNTVSMNLGLTVGPMLGGVLIGGYGAQAAYLVDTVAFAATLYAMWRLPAMRPSANARAAPPSSTACASSASSPTCAPASSPTWPR